MSRRLWQAAVDTRTEPGAVVEAGLGFHGLAAGGLVCRAAEAWAVETIRIQPEQSRLQPTPEAIRCVWTMLLRSKTR